ncbi:MAG: FadR family transcriptional regulator [Hyphomicrobiaceae bacterium]|nr:MAG: FadR family transcriptional regulator [Hyphomicrobiaceae bacterium]
MRMTDQINAEIGLEDPKAALVQLRAFIAAGVGLEDGRLPPERELSDQLGITRSELRKALAMLEAEGQIWRHVGKGTFVGGRPIDTVADIAAMARRTSPAEVMQARLSLEPEIARLAALHAKPEQIALMRACMDHQRSARTWREYEAWDNRLHRTIAEATQNALLLGLLDTLNAVRRAVTWGRLRPADRPMPSPDHHSFAEHESIVIAIENRDLAAAAASMRRHLQTVQVKLLNPE